MNHHLPISKSLHIWLSALSALIVSVYTFIHYFFKSLDGNPGLFGAAFVASPVFGIGAAVIGYLVGILILWASGKITLTKFVKYILILIGSIISVALVLVIINLIFFSELMFS